MVQQVGGFLMVKYSFYRPHKRVTFDNTKLDLKTGELVEFPL